MKILLDTHTFLWFIAGDAQLDGYARQLIEDPGNEGLILITQDQAFSAYGVQVAWSSP